ncbi:MAG: hypothetical protein ABIQ95_10715 [Bdellovibrionia bacterium]
MSKISNVSFYLVLILFGCFYPLHRLSAGDSVIIDIPDDYETDGANKIPSHHSASQDFYQKPNFSKDASAPVSRPSKSLHQVIEQRETKPLEYRPKSQLADLCRLNPISSPNFEKAIPGSLVSISAELEKSEGILKWLSKTHILGSAHALKVVPLEKGVVNPGLFNLGVFNVVDQETHRNYIIKLTNCTEAKNLWRVSQAILVYPDQCQHLSANGTEEDIGSRVTTGRLPKIPNVLGLTHLNSPNSETCAVLMEKAIGSMVSELRQENRGTTQEHLNMNEDIGKKLGALHRIGFFHQDLHDHNMFYDMKTRTFTLIDYAKMKFIPSSNENELQNESIEDLTTLGTRPMNAVLEPDLDHGFSPSGPMAHKGKLDTPRRVQAFQSYLQNLLAFYRGYLGERGKNRVAEAIRHELTESCRDVLHSESSNAKLETVLPLLKQCANGKL